MAKAKSRQPLIQKLLTRGMGYQREGRTELAEECYRNALKIDPRCAEALRLGGWVATRAGRESIRSTNTAPALDPSDPGTLTSVAKSYLDRGETEAAVGNYRRVVELCPQSVE